MKIHLASSVIAGALLLTSVASFACPNSQNSETTQLAQEKCNKQDIEKRAQPNLGTISVAAEQSQIENPTNQSESDSKHGRHGRAAMSRKKILRD